MRSMTHHNLITFPRRPDVASASVSVPPPRTPAILVIALPSGVKRPPMFV